jgi:hypothetical protein
MVKISPHSGRRDASHTIADTGPNQRVEKADPESPRLSGSLHCSSRALLGQSFACPVLLLPLPPFLLTHSSPSVLLHPLYHSLYHPANSSPHPSPTVPIHPPHYQTTMRTPARPRHPARVLHRPRRSTLRPAVNCGGSPDLWQVFVLLVCGDVGGGLYEFEYTACERGGGGCHASIFHTGDGVKTAVVLWG